MQLPLLGNPPECVEAILGVTATGPLAVVYAKEKYIKGLMRENKWKREDALDWFEFNTARGLEYMNNQNKPIIVDTDCIKG